MSTKKGITVTKVHLPTDGRPLTPEETAVFLRLDTQTDGGTDTVIRYHKQGLLKGARVGRGIIFPLKNIHDFLERQSEKRGRIRDDEDSVTDKDL